MSEVPLIMQAIDVPTLILYGPDDQVVPKEFPDRCEVAFPNRISPLFVPRCAHFLQWERADVLNESTKSFFLELKL